MGEIPSGLTLGNETTVAEPPKGLQLGEEEPMPETFTDSVAEGSLPSQKKLSGKNLDIISTVSANTFANNPIFKDEKNRETYYSTLYNKGYTFDDVNVIKSNIDKAVGTAPISVSIKEEEKPYSVTLDDVKSTPQQKTQRQITVEVGGQKEHNVMKSTIDLFNSDATYSDPDKKQAYYEELNKRGIATNDIFKNSVDNAIQEKKVVEGKGFYALLNPSAQPAKMIPEMLSEGQRNLGLAGDKIKDQTLFGVGEAAVLATKGFVDTALGALTATPPGIIFVNAIEAAHSVAPELVDFLMAPVSHSAKYFFDYEPKTDAEKALFGLMDFAGFGVALAAGHAKGPKAANYIKDIIDPTGKANKEMKLKALTDAFGKLTPEQKANAANLYADMKMNELNKQDIIPKSRPLNVRQSDYLEKIPRGTFTPAEEAAKVVEAVTEQQQTVKTNYEAAKKEVTSNTQEQVTNAISDHFPKLLEYTKDFNHTQPLNEVADGLAVKYQGRNGQLRRSETGEITFTDFNNGKSEIVTGGGNTTPFNESGFSLNEGYYKDKHGEYFVQGDNVGYTVYEIKDGKLKPVYEGEKSNQARKEAIIKKALNKTDTEILHDQAQDKAVKLQVTIEKAKLEGNQVVVDVLMPKLEQAINEAAEFEGKNIEQQAKDAEAGAIKANAEKEIANLSKALEDAPPEVKVEIEQAIIEREKITKQEEGSVPDPAEMDRRNPEIREVQESIAKEIKDNFDANEIKEFRDNMSVEKMEKILQKLIANKIIKIDC